MVVPHLVRSEKIKKMTFYLNGHFRDSIDCIKVL